jgi:hypothetical protein
MKRILALGALLAAFLALPSAAFAERVQFGQNDVITIDPQRAYILFRVEDRWELLFLREVDAAERSAWEAARQTAFERALARNQRSIVQWDRDMSQCTGQNAVSAYCTNRGPRPAPLTIETFAFPAPEMDNFVEVSRGRYFEQMGSSYVYLRAVDPGTYILYGPVIIAPNGAAAGVCLCMGSVRFEARAGQIVDMGEIRFDGVASGGQKGRFGPDGHRLPAPAVIPPRPDAGRPARLANLSFAPATLRAADRMPNYFGILIDRLAPIPGVLGYEQGRVIDLTGGGSTSGSR